VGTWAFGTRKQKAGREWVSKIDQKWASGNGLAVSVDSEERGTSPSLGQGKRVQPPGELRCMKKNSEKIFMWKTVKLAEKIL